MNGTVMALGFFDGVHAGHRKILQTAAALAAEKGLRPAACTFDIHPRAFVRGIAPAMLSTLHGRCELIKEQGIEQVEVLTFTEEMAAMTPQQFAMLLKEKYACRCAVCGENFRFGVYASGLPADLQKQGIETVVCTPVTDGGETVSSTRIRKLIADGDIVSADRLLCRPYVLTGKVVDGFKLGRRLGRPTMNLRPESGLILPHNGVYAARVLVDGAVYDSVTNVGTRPTFSNDDIISIESHIMDFDADIYGHTAQVAFVEKLRDEIPFGSQSELAAQINADIERASQILAK